MMGVIVKIDPTESDFLIELIKDSDVTEEIKRALEYAKENEKIVCVKIWAE